MQVHPLSHFKIDISQYKKGKKANTGGYGSVFEAKDIKTGNLYAAKVINCGNANKCQEFIDTEIRIMGSLQHPTIIKFFGYSEIDFDKYPNATIIMELAKKGSLFDYLQECKNGLGDTDFTDTTRQIILVGIARGMKYLHDHNICHCDLKSSNVLLDDEYHPKITDFGLSRIIDYNASSRVTTNRLISTLQYRAPESATDNIISRKVDVYAFGILMFEVVTDQIPYPDLANGKITDYKFTDQIVKDQRRPIFNKPETIKPSIKSLIEQCWSHNPKDRPTFDEIFDKLSGKLNDDINDDNDNYFLGGINVSQLKEYVEDISVVEDTIEALLDKIEKLKNTNQLLQDENQKLKSKSQKADLLQEEKDFLLEKQTISSFNHLPLNLQIAISNQLKSNKFFKKVSDLIHYISGKVPADSSNLLVIQNKNNDQLLSESGENWSIHILSKFTEILYQTELLKSNDFINLIKKFDNISIEIEYPSKSFDKTYLSLIEIKKSKFDDQNQFKIAILISSIKENDHRFYNDAHVNVLRLSNSVSILKSDNDNGLFEGCTSLSEISMPSSLKCIGKSSFKGCSSLTEISIPQTVTQIESYSFSECSFLSSIELPSNIEGMSDSVFEGCLSISLTNKMNAIPNFCFTKSSSLTEIFIPSSIKEIGAHSFSRCSSLRRIFLPSSIVKVGFYAFENCTSLEEINFPNKISEIGNFVLNGCCALKKCTLPPNIPEIGSFFFSGCLLLTEILIPKKVKSIGNFAFSGCSALQKVELPESVEFVGNYAFGECSNLKSVSILGSVNEIDPEAFDGCSSIVEVKASRLADVKEDCFPAGAKFVYGD